MGIRVVRIRVGKISPLIQKELVLAEVLNGTKREQVLQMSHTPQIYWCGYGLEIHVLLDQEDSKNGPTRQNIKYDSRWPTSYCSKLGQRGHIQKY